MTSRLMGRCQVGQLLADLVVPYVWNDQRHSQLKIFTRFVILIVIANFFHLIMNIGGIKSHSRRVMLRPHPFLHVCLVLTFGIELHTYRSALSCKKEKIFLVMVLNIIGRNKVYFGCYHIGKPNFCVITLMSCTQREMCLF